MKKTKKKKGKIREIIMIGIVFCLLIFILLTFQNNNLKVHCAKAVCNKDNTICYNYKIDDAGKTIKTWEGNCAKLK